MASDKNLLFSYFLAKKLAEQQGVPYVIKDAVGGQIYCPPY
jgi:hypothetical protein